MPQRPKKLLHFWGLFLIQQEFEQDIGVEEIH